jgi:hypothetical protein
MSSRKYIHDELRELNSTLPSHVKEPVFSVPEGYFENFAASVLMRLKQEEAVDSAADELASLSPLLAGLSKKMPYDLPENYFTTLSNDVPALIQDDELPAILAGHQKTTPYEVPMGYFDNLPEQVLSKVAPKQAKVVSFNRTRWMRVAAAAIVAGVMAISGLVYYSSSSNTNPTSSPEAWIANQLKNISNQDLDSFIESTDATSTEQMASTNSGEVSQMLNDVSVKEIDAFLAQIPTDDEELSIIN